MVDFLYLVKKDLTVYDNNEGPDHRANIANTSVVPNLPFLSSVW